MVKDFAIFQVLLDEIKAKFGKSLETNGDFEALSESIMQCTGSYVSTTTLKRYWRKKDAKSELSSNIHTSILNTLASYIGYSGYEAFENKETLIPTKTSHTITSKRISSANLAKGQHLRLTWAPDRKVVIRHEEENKFTVIESINSKLLRGDQFEVCNIVSRCPLLLFNLQHGDNPPTDYICGQDYSLGVEFID